MRKLTMLGLSLLLSVGVYAAPQAVKAAKASASSKANVEVFKAKGLESSQTRQAETRGFVVQKNYVTRPVTKIKRAPAKAAVTTDKIYAGMIYPQALLGAGKLNVATGTYTPIVKGAVGVHNIGVNADLNELYAIMYNSSSSGVSNISVGAYDLTTGAVKRSRTVSSQEEFDPFIQRGAYVPEENAFYGFCNKGWAKLDCATLESTVLKEYANLSDVIFSNFTFNSKTQTIDAVKIKTSGTSELWTVDVETGAATKKADINVSSQYIGGFGYDYSSDSYLYNPNDDATSTIVSIDANTYAVTELCEIPGAPETACLYIDEQKPADPLAPVAPEFIGASFPTNETTGQVTFQMPTLTAGGTAIAAGTKLTYVISANGTQIATGTATPGQNVLVNAIDMTAGMVTFSCTAAIGSHVSKAATADVYVGDDTPSMPRNVKLNTQTVTWDAVVTGAHGGYVNPEAITYTVTLNGKVIAEDIKATSCATNIPLNAELSNYVAQVTASYAGLVSAPGSSNQILFGQAFSEPVEFLPTEDQVDLFTIIDNNNDGKAWTYYATDDAFRIAYNSRLASDDYLILPPVNIQDIESIHLFQMDYWAGSTSYPEKFDVYIGRENTVDGMNRVVDVVDVKSTDHKTLNSYITFPETGKWYIAVRACSDRDMLRLNVNNFKLSVSNAKITGPAAITDVNVVPGDKGALNATVSFKMPTVDNAGNALKGDVTATLETLVDLKTVTGKPGSAQKVTLNTIQGDNDIEVNVSCNNITGMPSVVPVYTGVDLLGPVTDLRLDGTESNLGIAGSYEAPVEGANGGYIDRTGIDYSLWQKVQIGSIFGIPIYKDTEIGKIGKDVMSFQTEDMLPEGSPLGSYQLGIAGTNAAGTGVILYTSSLLGTPYSLPMLEDFTKGSMTYSPIMLNTQGGMKQSYLNQTGLNNLDPKFATVNAAVVGQCATDGYGYWFLPKFSTLGKNKVAFKMNYYVGACKNVKIYAETYDVPRTEIMDVNTVLGLPEGYQDLIIDLPAQFQNKAWVSITLYTEFSADQKYFVWQSYDVVNMVQKDMVAMDITAPKKVATGADYKVGVTVANYGITDAAGYTVELYANEEKVAEKTCGELASYAENSVEFELAMSPVADEPIAYYAVVKQAGDVDNDNDKTATVEVSPKASSLPGATALTAGSSEGAVDLTWDEPDMENITPEPVTDDFEDADAFADEYGDWVFVDVDGNTVGGFNNMDIPGITPGQTIGSFWIWDQSQLGNETFAAHSGTKYLFTLFDYQDGTIDDWAISPELAGVEQTIEFYAKSYSGDYPEKIEVWYSTGSTDPKDFIKIEDAGADVVPAEWTLFEAFVPEGAKRFAIRSNGTSSFMLMVDDVTYIPAGGVTGDLTLKGYNVYRDGVKINDEVVEETVYADTNVTEGTEYTYVVVAIFEEGNGKMSNKATIKYQTSGLNSLEGGKLVAAGKGEIVIKGFEGEKVLISTADGKIIANGVAAATETVNVPAGIYVVKAGKNSVKVVVR